MKRLKQIKSFFVRDGHKEDLFWWAFVCLAIALVVFNKLFPLGVIPIVILVILFSFKLKSVDKITDKVKHEIQIACLVLVIFSGFALIEGHGVAKIDDLFLEGEIRTHSFMNYDDEQGEYEDESTSFIGSTSKDKTGKKYIDFALLEICVGSIFIIYFNLKKNDRE